MSAFFVALFALVCAACTSPAESQVLGFRRMTANAAWPARYAGTVEQLDMPVTAGGITYPSGSFVLHGGHSAPTTPLNDVWISSNLGTSWSRLAGGSGGATTYIPTAYASYTKDSSNRLFKLGGRTTTQQLVNDVWVSANGGVSWTRQPSTAATRFGPIQSADLISSPTLSGVDALYLVGGLQGDAASGPGVNDAWTSLDHGQTWKRAGSLNVAAPPGRAQGSLLSHQPVQRARQSVLFYLGGSGRSNTGTVTYYNDIHVSTNNGANWARIPRNALWTRRGNFNAEVTPSGTIVLTSGFNEDRGAGGGSLNDVWASMDGGFTWGQCMEDAQFSDRSYQMTMMDNAGYFYVMAGNEGFNNGSTTRILKNDVWRSTWSLNDAASVSRLCNIPVPACGVGLTCMPGDSNTKYVGNQITCPAIEACQSGRMSFTAKTLAAEWPARHSAGFEVWTGKDVKIAGTTYKSGSFVLWSGAGVDNVPLTDTWVSTDALTWTEVPTSSKFQGAIYSGHAIDSTGRMYKIGGQRDGQRVGDVYVSVDMGQKWTLQKPTKSFQALPPREFPDVFVDSLNNVYVVGGLDGDGLNDVWQSTNQGKDWHRRGQIPFVNAGGRSSAALLIYKNELLGQEFMTYMGGFSRAGGVTRYYNDVWVSSNQGTRWVRVTERAPWPERDNFNAEVTSDGLIVISSGYNNRAIYNDLWISADGGYTWTNCIDEAPFSDRRWQSNAIDNAGNLWVIGGEAREDGRNELVNDVWKSTISFRKPKGDLLKACPALKLPKCAYGLSCFPGSQILRAGQPATCPKLEACVYPDDPTEDSTGGVDPDCDPDWEDCPVPSSSTGTAASEGGLSTGAVILIAILVIVGVVAIAGYFYYKRKAQKDSETFGQEGLLGVESSNISFANLGPSTQNDAPHAAQV